MGQIKSKSTQVNNYDECCCKNKTVLVLDEICMSSERKWNFNCCKSLKILKISISMVVLSRQIHAINKRKYEA